MKSRIELDQDGETSSEAKYVDPDPCDRSEEDFAISLSVQTKAASRFVVEESEADSAVVSLQEKSLGYTEVPSGTAELARLPIDEARDENSDNTWRQEVSARLSKYQSRKRPREPRYPSLQLKFEPQENWHPAPGEVEPSSYGQLNTTALARTAEVVEPSVLESIPQRASVPQSEPKARILEFPRSLTTPEIFSDELAEPVFERPRIMEAPEIVSPPRALAGILIEKIEAPANEKRPGFEMPLQAARMGRRLAATLIDALIVLVAVTVFVVIFWRVTGLIPPTRLSAGMALFAVASFWAGYQWLLVVYSGTTPGLKLAKLQLSNFDGSVVPRKKRGWRVLASGLSGVSLGLGYAWSFLDEDQLCWHDRITKTYIAPK